MVFFMILLILIILLSTKQKLFGFFAVREKCTSFTLVKDPLTILPKENIEFVVL